MLSSLNRPYLVPLILIDNHHPIVNSTRKPPNVERKNELFFFFIFLRISFSPGVSGFNSDWIEMFCDILIEDINCKLLFILISSLALYPLSQGAYSFRKNSTTPFELKLLDKFTSYLFFFVLMTIRTVQGGIEPRFSAASFNLLNGLCLSKEIYKEMGLLETNCLCNSKESSR